MRLKSMWLAALLVVLSACDSAEGSGVVVRETRDVADFSAVVLRGSGTLELTQGSESLGRTRTSDE